MIEFKEFPKIFRMNREVIVTEKLDGINAAIVIDEEGNIAAQSRNRLIYPGDDNYAFAFWVNQNKEQLLKMGPGHHFGEWWGKGIARNYGVDRKYFSLFNTYRWKTCCSDAPGLTELPPVQGLGVVPVLATLGPTDPYSNVMRVVELLRSNGSVAAPGFMRPEGVVVFHTQSNSMFKVTLEKDNEHKGPHA